MCDRTSVTPDFLWPEEKLALEYDSSEFHARKGAPQAARDAARSNFLAIKGYRVLRVAAGNVSSLSGAALLARQIAFALGAPLREPTPLELQRRNKLYMELMPKAAAGGCGRRAAAGDGRLRATGGCGRRAAAGDGRQRGPRRRRTRASFVPL